MAASQNPCMEAAAEKLYDANADFVARERARAFLEYQRKERDRAQLERENAEQKAALAEKDAALAEKDTALTEKDTALTVAQARIAELERLLAAK